MLIDEYHRRGLVLHSYSMVGSDGCEASNQVPRAPLNGSQKWNNGGEIVETAVFDSKAQNYTRIRHLETKPIIPFSCIFFHFLINLRSFESKLSKCKHKMFSE